MAQKQSENSTFKKMNDSRVMMQTEEPQQCLMQHILRQCIHGYNSIYGQPIAPTANWPQIGNF